jgi:hydroxyacylglutathione hydrolase
MQVETVIAGHWAENCYVVTNDDAEALIIDPGGSVERILHRVEAHGVRVLAILNTHGHYDHVGAVEAVRQACAAPFYLHSRDEKLMKQTNFYLKLFHAERPVPLPQVDHYLDELITPLKIGAFTVGVLPVPGHTAGSVSFVIEGHLFSGDTLLKGKIGRTDLPGGNPGRLTESLRALCRLAPEIQVCPGHGDRSTMLNELKSNQELAGVARCE